MIGLMVALLSLQTLRYSGAWTDDIQLFTWATERVPNSTKAHHKLGEEYLRAGNLGAALKSLRRSLEIAPDNQFAALTLAQARSAVVRRYPALSTGSGSAEKLPSDPEILYLLGQLRRERGDLAGAVGLWTSALKLDPTHPETLADLGAVRLMEGDTTAALVNLTSAVQHRPSLASAWYALGRIHLARGQRQEAVRDLRRFISHAGGRYPEQARWARQVLTDLVRD
jgi:cytochrome c-type biogenesis protein CcmH/NrfG